MKNKDIKKLIDKKLELAEEQENTSIFNIGKLFIETHAISSEGGCVFVNIEKCKQKWKDISFLICEAYAKSAYARAIREIYYEINDLTDK